MIFIKISINNLGSRRFDKGEENTYIVSMETKKHAAISTPSEADSDIDIQLLDLFKELSEKQDVFLKLTARPFIFEYGQSELHCLDAIGRTRNPNVSKLAEQLSITRGAASKIVKRLLERGDLGGYQMETNKKEVYYTLTDRGRKIFEAHAQSHQIWRDEDLRFFQSVPLEDKRILCRFMRRFIHHVRRRITELEQAAPGPQDGSDTEGGD